MFQQFGFTPSGQRGSHLKLQREIEGSRQTLIIPLHAELDTGTSRAVFRQAWRYIDESELRGHFFTE